MVLTHILQPLKKKNHRISWVGRDLKDRPVLSPLPWAQTPSIILGCSKSHPTQL